MPYYAQHGWNAEVLAVNPRYSDFITDNLLMQSLPEGTVIHYVKALNKRWTSKLGLGSIALRSMWYYLFAANRLLRQKHYDIIFFSTTQFPLLVLAARWRSKFKVKIVFDLQDPWHTDYYKHRPKHERPKKFWFSYQLNKFLEPIAMRAADGLISVSSSYITTLQKRYPWLKHVPAAVIPFGLHRMDLEIAKENAETHPAVLSKVKNFHLVYVGRGGHDLLPAFKHLFQAINLGLQTDPDQFNNLRLRLYGTSYAAAGTGKSILKNEVDKQGLNHIFSESTDRLPYYHSLNTLRGANLLFIPGSVQPEYTASKIFPYLLAQRPILAVAHRASATTSLLTGLSQVQIIKLDQDDLQIVQGIKAYLQNAMTLPESTTEIPVPNLREFTSEHLTRLQTQLFNQVCKLQN
jgi:hypothetical protein